MKNQILVILMAISAIFFVTSCSRAPQAGPGIDVEYSADTVLTHDVPVLVNRDNCEKKTIPTIMKDGKPIGQKVDGWEEKTDLISMSGVVNISDQKLNESGYQYSGKSVAPISDVPTDPDKVKSYNNGFMNAWVGFWNFFGPLLGWILAILLAVLILYLLYRLLRWLFNQFGSESVRRDENQTQHVTQTITREPREDRIFVIGGQGLPAGTMVGASNASNFFGGTHNHNHFYGNNVTVSNDRVNQNPPQS